MKRSSLNLLINCVSLAVMSLLLATGMIIRFALPPGSGRLERGNGLTLWGWRRHDWGDVHYYLAIIMLALLVLHIALHWRWIVAVLRRPRTAAGILPNRRVRLSRIGVASAFTAATALAIAAWFASGSQITSRPVQRGETPCRRSPAVAGDHLGSNAPQPSSDDGTDGRKHRRWRGGRGGETLAYNPD